MKIVLIILLLASSVMAQPLRVALLDFENNATASLDKAVVGGINPQVLAEKGVYTLGKLLARQKGFVLIDRRNFIRQLQQSSSGAKKGTIKPSFLRAAQAVNADAVIRGVILSYAPGKKTINQGGYQTEFVTLSLRVALEALDTRDGTIIAVADGRGRKDLRQSSKVRTVVGEDELLDLLDDAIAEAVPELERSLQKKMAQERERPKIKLSVQTSADPAMVEIDGMLIGTTPLVDFRTYKGDHIITVGKAGYRDVNKRILLSKDTSIEIPLIRTELNADELKEILEKARLNIITGTAEPALVIIDTENAGKGK